MHRATCKAIKTAADLFIRIRDYKGGLWRTPMRVSFKRSRKKPDQTLVKAGELYYEYKLNSQQHLEYDRFFTKYIQIYKKYIQKSCPFTNIYHCKKTAFLRYRFFTQRYICVCVMILRFLFFIQTFWTIVKRLALKSISAI